MRKLTDKPRVFCIGWHKTGTSTLGHALVELGYSVLGCRLDMVHPLKRQNFESVMALAGDFDALQDVPWAALFRELDDRYPGSRFILTERDEQSWLQSASRHFGGTNIPLHEWLYGNGVLVGNEDLYLERFRRHDREIRQHFSDRESDLLIMNLAAGDGWNSLCEFLGHPVPSRPFPHANKGPDQLNSKEKAHSALRRLAPWRLRKLVFATRQRMRDVLGQPDPRNVFNNMKANRQERASWPVAKGK